VILPVFFDPDALKADPELQATTARGDKAIDEWVTFVCPSRESFRKRKIEYIKKIVTDVNPDGLSIDFIRHFGFWEKVYPDRTLESLPNTCFDSACIERFQKATGIKIPANITGSQAVAAWLQSNKREAWINWKCDLITSFIKEAAAEARKLKPDILINVHAVPWRRDDFGGAIRSVMGQDFGEIAKYVT